MLVTRGSFPLGLMDGLDARISHVERMVNKAATVAVAMFDDQQDREFLVSLGLIHDVKYSNTAVSSRINFQKSAKFGEGDHASVLSSRLPLGKGSQEWPISFAGSCNGIISVTVRQLPTTPGLSRGSKVKLQPLTALVWLAEEGSNLQPPDPKSAFAGLLPARMQICFRPIAALTCYYCTLVVTGVNK